MITLLELERPPFCKPYKNMLRKARADSMAELEDITGVLDEPIKILLPVNYELCRLMHSSFLGKMAKRMTVGFAAKHVKDIVNKDRSKIYDTELSEEELIRNLGPNKVVMSMDTLLVDLAEIEGNKGILGDMIVEASITSYLILLSSSKKFCPTLLNINCLLVYYWALKYFDFSEVLKLAKKTKYVECQDVLKITKNDTFDEIIDKLDIRDSCKKLILSYLKSYNEHPLNDNTPYYEHIDGFVKEIIECSKTDSLIADKLKEYEKSITESQGEDGFDLINKKRAKKYAAAALSSSVELLGSKVSRNACGVWIYHNYLVNNKLIKMSEHYIETYNDFIQRYTKSRIYQSTLYYYMTLSRVLCQADKDNEQQKDLKERMISSEESLKAKISEMRKDLRCLNRQVDTLEKEKKADKARIQELELEVSTEKVEVDLDEHNKLKDEIEKLRGIITQHDAIQLETDRKLSKKDKELEQLTKKLDDMETEQLKLMDKYDREKEINAEMSACRAFSKIPIKCFVNVIQNKRIAIIGGNMMHAKLREYGLDGFRYYEAGYRGITYEEISNMELLVIATAFIDHATTDNVNNLARAHNIPVIRFNNKNAEMLIYALFEEVTK